MRAMIGGSAKGEGSCYGLLKVRFEFGSLETYFDHEKHRILTY